MSTSFVAPPFPINRLKNKKDREREAKRHEWLRTKTDGTILEKPAKIFIAIEKASPFTTIIEIEY